MLNVKYLLECRREGGGTPYLEGMEKGYPLRDPVERNVYEMTEEERKRYKIDSLPEDLYEAIKITEK